MFSTEELDPLLENMYEKHNYLSHNSSKLILEKDIFDGLKIIHVRRFQLLNENNRINYTTEIKVSVSILPFSISTKIIVI